MFYNTVIRKYIQVNKKEVYIRKKENRGIKDRYKKGTYKSSKTEADLGFYLL